mgnify:CR=1 FL=1
MSGLLKCLTGNGVHIVTVNDYLAKRDAEWMGKVHEFLGLKVGVILNDMEKQLDRKHMLAILLMLQIMNLVSTTLEITW